MVIKRKAEIKPTSYYPPIAIHPGESLRDSIEILGITQLELAKRIGISKKVINEIINGKAPITAETAVKLETIIDVPASFWLKLQSNFEETVARLELEKVTDLELEIAKNIPYTELAKRGFVIVTRIAEEKVLELRRFFRISNLKRMKEVSVAYRCGSNSSNNQVLKDTWIQMGLHLSKEIEVNNFNMAKLKSAVPTMRSLAHEMPDGFYYQLQKLCADCGIALVLNEHLPKADVYGACVWNDKKTKVTLMMTVYRKRADIFWFTFFHELGHIIQGNKSDSVDCEWDADDFAASILIPHEQYDAFVQRSDFSYSDIMQFSKMIEMHPSIVIGRLQHDKLIPFDSKLSSLIPKFTIVTKYKN